MTAGGAAVRRGGFALVLSILLIMALGLLSTAMVAVAVHEARIAATVETRARARAAAEAAVRRALGSWSTHREDSLATGGSRSPDPGGATGSSPPARTRIERLDTSLFLVSATATRRAGSSAATGSAAAFVRILDTHRLARNATPAAATADRVALHGGAVSGVDACASLHPHPGILAPNVIRTGGMVEGDPPVVTDPGTGPIGDAFEMLPFEHMEHVSPGGPVGSPAPSTRSGVCVPGPWNWGTAEPEHPCRGAVLIHVPGDLTLRGGRGFGILVVEGDLRLADGFTFDGLILVRGRAVVDSAAIQGALRARELEVRAGSLRFHACHVERAFRAPAFDRAFRPAGRWWLPAF